MHPTLRPKLAAKMHQTVRRHFTKLYSGNVPNSTAAIYRTFLGQCTKLYGGNWRSGCGGIPKKYPGESRKPKSPYPNRCTTAAIMWLHDNPRRLAMIPLHRTLSKHVMQ